MQFNIGEGIALFCCSHGESLHEIVWLRVATTGFLPIYSSLLASRSSRIRDSDGRVREPARRCLVSAMIVTLGGCCKSGETPLSRRGATLFRAEIPRANSKKVRFLRRC